MICLMIPFLTGCVRFQASNATACNVGFDYDDNSVNKQNKKALLVHYCICFDDKLCEKED